MTAQTHALIQTSVQLIEYAISHLMQEGGPEHRSATIDVLRRAAAASRDQAPLIMAEIERRQYTREIKRLRDRLSVAIEASAGDQPIAWRGGSHTPLEILTLLMHAGREVVALDEA